MKKKKIIWVEDNPGINREVRDLINKNHEAVICQRVVDLKKCIENTKPDDIAGFIFDVMLREHDLSDLGLPDVETDRGFTAGYQIVRFCFLGIDEEYCDEIDFVKKTLQLQKPILMLSVLDAGITQSELEEENDVKLSVEIITKRPDCSANWLDEVENWLKSL